MGRGGRCKQSSLACVGSARSVWATLGLPHSRWRVLPGSTLLRLQGTLPGHCPKWALRFAYFPGLSCSGSRELRKGRLGWLCIWCPSQVRAAKRRPDESPRWTVCLNHLLGPGCWVSWRCHESTVSSVCCVSSGWLISGCDPPWQMSTVQDPRKTWLATGSLLTVWWRMLVSGAEIAAASCLPTLAVARMPFCLWRRGGACTQMASSPLVFVRSFVL